MKSRYAYEFEGNPKLDIGCGHFPRDGFIGVDTVKHEGIINWDLEKSLEYFTSPDTVAEVWADNVLEHINNLIPLMNSVYNIMLPGGRFHIRVPLANTVGALKDPTHVRHFVPESFDYFDLAWDYPRQPDYGIRKWQVEKKVIEKESDDYQYIYVVLRKPLN